MNDYAKKAEQRITELLDSVYGSLTTHTAPPEERDLRSDEFDIVSNLSEHSFLHRALLRLLAIETCAANLVSRVACAEELNAALPAAAQSVNLLGAAVERGAEQKIVLQKYAESRDALARCIKVAQ
jgi:hypothetical protein